jgi:hypothetical protein
MPDWFIDVFTNLAGVSLGVFLGYYASRRLARREDDERRKVLVETLTSQIADLPDPSQVGSANIRRIFVISALGHLLSGDVLNATKHRDLLRELVNLEDWLAQYNEFIDKRNLLFDLDKRRDIDRWDAVATDIYVKIHRTRAEVLAILPSQTTGLASNNN